MTYRKKLIEVALPLDAINKESAREKSIRHGHPSTLHLWWARRPLAACRAVLFASLVDDPSNDLPKEEAKVERDRLFGILEDLVKWENSNDENVLGRARAEILRSTNGNPPPVLDPFCGGGSIPLEAQRLGLETHGSDLNPVAVLITKALIEIPPKFAGKPPVNPASRAKIGNEGNWRGAQGLADDVRYYGRWMRDEAEKRIGHLYPKGPNGETVIAWLWARTVGCPNPACGARMPLVSSFWLSKKQGKQAWVEPVVDRAASTVSFKVRTGDGLPQNGTVNRRGATCVVCGSVARLDYIRTEGRAKRMDQQLMCVVAEGARGRTYLSPMPDHVSAAEKAEPIWRPDTELAHNPRDIKAPTYGLTTHGHLFTPRQLVTLTTLSDLVGKAQELVLHDAAQVNHADGVPPNEGSRDVQAYAGAVATYLAFCVDRTSDYNSNICSWHNGRDTIRNTFARQAIPMTWDFAEANPFSDSTGSFSGAVTWVEEVVGASPASSVDGVAEQRDATASVDGVIYPVISTDPPYYDNIGYADLADFFYR